MYTYNSFYAIFREISAQRLVRCYGNLYSQGRVNALEALDSIPQLQGARELKFKILFSIVVVSKIQNNLLDSTYSFFKIKYSAPLVSVLFIRSSHSDQPKPC